MGVVTRPIPHRNFNVRVHMERVLKTVFLQKRTTHQDYSHDALINSEIKEGRWLELVSCEETIDEIAQQIMITYELEKYVSDRLEFYYVTQVDINRNTKDVVLELSDSIKD